MGIGIGSVKDFGKKAVNKAKDVGRKAVDKTKDVGGKAVDKAKDVGGKAVDKAKDVGGGAVNKAKDVGGKAVDKAKDLGGDAVEFSKEAYEWKQEQEKNFAAGVLEWGKGTVDTAVNIAKNPVESAKAVGKLATNPVLNPLVGLPLSVAQGKNPVDAYKEGAGDLKDIGVGIYDDYKKVYNEHGVAGLAGNLAPDIAIGILTGGSGSAAKAGGTTAAKGIAKEVTEEAVEKAVTREVAEGAVRETAKDAAKNAAKELVPGPSDVVDQERGEKEDRNIWHSLLDMFV